jgi:hypothetical protein
VTDGQRERESAAAAAPIDDAGIESGLVGPNALGISVGCRIVRPAGKLWGLYD